MRRCLLAVLCSVSWLVVGCATSSSGTGDEVTDGAVEVLGEDETDPLPDDDDVVLPDDDAGTIKVDVEEPAADAEPPIDDVDYPVDDADLSFDAGTLPDVGFAFDAGVPRDVGTPPRDVGTPPRDVGFTPPCVRTVYRLRHLQSAQQRTDSESRRRASIDAAFGAGAQSISWTEIENLSDVRYIQARAGWTTYWPSGRAELVARNAVPVSWRDDTFRLVRGTSRFASAGRAGVSPSRWVTRVWLRHRSSGGILSRVAHHSVSGVDGSGRAPVAWRRMTHALDIAAFRDVMELDNVPVVGSGDFNTTRLRSLLGSEFDYDVPTSGGSHGGRLIDWVVHLPHSQQRFVGAHFVTVGSSDHRGVSAGYDYTPPCR
ncbi:MAG: hypothetical protein JWM10_2645 [Myxococcaceae bacterium]|nr:hypothetical protein [Myxococcaceae bacterium]